MVPASGVSSSHKTRFLPSYPNEICVRIILLLQEKLTGNNSEIFDEEIVAIADRILEHQCISVRQHKILLLKCSK